MKRAWGFPQWGSSAARRRIMVIYGHDKKANAALFLWLHMIGLEPLEWSELVRMSDVGSPYNGQVLDQAFKQAQAVLAFFTPDEIVAERGASPNEEEAWRYQARPNVMIEAGMALATHPQRTVLLVLGKQELPSDLAGRHFIRIDGTSRPLYNLKEQLAAAGCDVDRSGSDWLDPGIFPSRD